ncbi:MAG: helix-turn-helix transcriptional regulator [Caldilinea sp.]|jgi:DNA-binding PadR family transcriptional regulator
MNAQKRPLTTEYALLGLLRKKPLHGYELIQQIQAAQVKGLVWKIKQSMLYAVLGRLEEEGLVSSVLESQGARPPRKLFHLTVQGGERFAQWLRTPVQHGRDFRLELLTKLYFAVGEGAAVELIRRQIGASEAQIQRLAVGVGEAVEAGSVAGLVGDYRVGQMEAALAWLRRCEVQFASAAAAEEGGGG